MYMYTVFVLHSYMENSPNTVIHKMISININILPPPQIYLLLFHPASLLIKTLVSYTHCSQHTHLFCHCAAIIAGISTHPHGLTVEQHLQLISSEGRRESRASACAPDVALLWLDSVFKIAINHHR